MFEKDLIESWKQEEQQPFIGWDFSYVDGRMLEEQAPWSYSSRAAELMRRAQDALDMDTGGGERILRLHSNLELHHAWPARMTVTEGYPPNMRLALRRLKPLGVPVVAASMSDHVAIPFASGSFDLILNRHGGFNAVDVGRALAPGGTFLTQQVHGLWAEDLLAEFGAKPQWPTSTPAKYLPQLQAGGMRIVDSREWQGRLAFTDVGAIVYYLRAVPWLVPGFSVAGHVQALLRLQRRFDLEGGGALSFTARKYLIEAVKPD
jgi:SAM-dependent methyltransferase